MVDTLAPHGYAQRMRTTVLSCMTFAGGALTGGVLTYGGLALLGATLGAEAPQPSRSRPPCCSRTP